MARIPVVFLLIAALSVAFVPRSSVLAQPGPDERPLRDRIETVIIGKYTTELELTPEQAEKFFPRMHEYRGQLEDMLREQAMVQDRMQAFAEAPGADRKEVDALVDRQTELRSAMADRKRGFLNDIANFLSPQQVSRCSLLMDEMPRRMREFMNEQRQRGGVIGKGGPNPAPIEGRRGTRRSY